MLEAVLKLDGQPDAYLCGDGTIIVDEFPPGSVSTLDNAVERGQLEYARQWFTIATRGGHDLAQLTTIPAGLTPPN